MEPQLRWAAGQPCSWGMALAVSIPFPKDCSVISQMFCYLTGEIYTLLKSSKCFPSLLLPAGPTNGSGRASGGEFRGTFNPDLSPVAWGNHRDCTNHLPLPKMCCFFGRDGQI